MSALNERPVARRAVLAGAGLAALVVLLPNGRSAAASTRIGDLELDVPADLREQPAESHGIGWQWAAARGTTALVLARADLASTSTSEILGLLLAGAIGGGLPDMRLGEVADRAMTGGRQTRIEVSYGYADPATRRHGVLLIATRPVPPAAVVAVLGDQTLTAGTIDTVLDSVRWSQ